MTRGGGQLQGPGCTGDTALLVLASSRWIGPDEVMTMPIASLMEPGFDGIATVMEPPDRQGHGATCRVG
jgi:hypothetical protein